MVFLMFMKYAPLSFVIYQIPITMSEVQFSYSVFIYSISMSLGKVICHA